MTIQKPLYYRLLSVLLLFGGIPAFGLGVVLCYLAITKINFDLPMLAGGLFFIVFGCICEGVFIDTHRKIIVDEEEAIVKLKVLSVPFKQFRFKDFLGYNRDIAFTPNGRFNVIVLQTKENYQIAFGEKDTENYPQMAELIERNFFLKTEIKYRMWTRFSKMAMAVVIAVCAFLLIAIYLDQVKS
jgi:hypothetical protein